ncbi:MAG: thioredoxin-disulfide reductase [Acidimicrobiia bacterium]|nr:thioredoxin-disulfide reductase [Acidimicrobiia bacterium]NNF63496.1 thioredoxin-disulfide reductase [Acidimicrobiia bacterium]
MAENVIIIGSGPAGLTAAVYAARADLKPLMIEGMEAGGQLMLTTEVENYPGFPDGIMGPELMENFRKQAERFGTRIMSSNVTKVDFSQRPFKVWVGEDEYEGDSVIISTGASARWIGVPGEDKLRGYGVSSCATCDGFFFRDREIIVVGGGDSAMEEATFLTKFASKVTIVHRRDEFRASKIMARRALDNPKIEVLWNTVVEEIVGDKAVTGVKLRNVETDEASDLAVEGVFVAIGHIPNTNIFDGQLELDSEGYIVTTDHTRTSVEGVFAAGDVVDKVYRQAITAAGMGCESAIDAERWLEAQHDPE